MHRESAATVAEFCVAPTVALAEFLRGDWRCGFVLGAGCKPGEASFAAAPVDGPRFDSITVDLLSCTMTPLSSAAAPAPIAAPKFLIAQLDETTPVNCPCGVARRAFASSDNPVATIHLVEIQADAKVHYHKRMTEIYLVLEGEGFIELDGERVPVKPLTSVFIKPGCRHRAIGRLRIINVPIPAFDPSDEWFD